MNNELKSAQAIIADARLSHALNMEVIKAKAERSSALRMVCEELKVDWIGEN